MLQLPTLLDKAYRDLSGKRHKVLHRPFMKTLCRSP